MLIALLFMVSESYAAYHKSEVSQSAQRKPYRLATVQQRVQMFIEALRKGDKTAFERVEYDLLEGYFIPGRGITVGVIPALYVAAKENNRHIMDELYNGDMKIRANVVRATLRGLFNKDPRVRLVAINFLRRLRPDANMQREVKRAIALETVTTETPKFREKDLDIPNIENPRLGWFTHENDWSDQPDNINVIRHDDGFTLGGSYLNGTKAGDWMVKGLYQAEQRERNDYRVRNYYERNYRTGAITAYTVWSKFSYLRYGADEQRSGWEHVYKVFDKPLYSEQNPVEIMPRFRYLYIDNQDPESGEQIETLYDGYHSVWEEMLKLDHFISRVIWTEKIKDGDLNACRIMSKDTFRTLADQIDGESLDNVPTKSTKIFNEKDVKPLIVGLLENKVVSTREELARLLKQIYYRKDTSEPVRNLIKTALKRARRNELLIDTIRGRHLMEEVLPPRKGMEMDYYGEFDELDTTSDEVTPEKFELLREMVERPEESVIIYYDRRKPGQEEDDDEEGEEEGEEEGDDDEEGEGDDDEEGEDDDDEEGEDDDDEEGEDDDEAPVEAEPALKKVPKTPDTYIGGFARENVGHPLLEDKYRNLTYENISTYVEDLNTDRSKVYDRMRSLIVWTDLVRGNGNKLVGVSFYSLQNAILMGIKKARDSQRPFLDVMMLNMVTKQTEGAGIAIGNVNLELVTGDALTPIQNQVIVEPTKEPTAEVESVTPVEPATEDDDDNDDEEGEDDDDNDDEEGEDDDEEGEEEGDDDEEGEEEGEGDEAFKYTRPSNKKVPGREFTPEGKSNLMDKAYPTEAGRRTATDTYPFNQYYYGHGRGGYLGRYDEKVHLIQAEIPRGFYSIPKRVRSARAKVVAGLLKTLEDKDPQKRLLVIHLLRRLIPSPEMLPQVTKVLREMETVDKRRYRYVDTITFDDALGVKSVIDAKVPDAAADAQPARYQEKVVGDELIKLQRFIVRRILVNKIRSGKDKNLLREIPKGTFLTLVVRIDAEWDPWRIPLRCFRSWNESSNDKYFFFRPEDIYVIAGGLDNRNFIVQRECANWIVNFYEYNTHPNVNQIIRPTIDGNLRLVFGGSAKQADVTVEFLKSIRKAEAKDIVYYERNYLTQVGKQLIGRLDLSAADRQKATEAYQQLYNTALPKGRVTIWVDSRADIDIFIQIDADRKDSSVGQVGAREGSWEVYKNKLQNRSTEVQKYTSEDVDKYANWPDPNLDKYKQDQPYQRVR
jgi:hypothetical protein